VCDLFTFAGEPPPGLPTTPSLLVCDQLRLPSNPEEAVQMFRQYRHACVDIGSGGAPCAIAEKTKRVIDQTFREDVKFEDLSKRLKTSRYVMSRYFKRHYGLAPVQYRSRLRLMETHVLLAMKDYPISRAALEVGFNNVAQFNKIFARTMGGKPTSFRFRREGSRKQPRTALSVRPFGRQKHPTPELTT
jgi:AraC-like DNA-binding protein